LQGKTSNIEIDAVLRGYLEAPGIVVLPCTDICAVDQRWLQGTLKELFAQQGGTPPTILFPIYTRHHWIASIMSLDKDGSVTVTVYDSAPSALPTFQAADGRQW